MRNDPDTNFNLGNGRYRCEKGGMSNSSSESEDDLPAISLGRGSVSQRSKGHYQPAVAVHHSPVRTTKYGQKSKRPRQSPAKSHDNDDDVVLLPSTSAVVKKPKLHTTATAAASLSKKEQAQQERAERKKKEALEKLKLNEARRLEKERKQAEKKQQNEMKQALRKAASDTSKESRAPGDRVKKMTVVLEKALVESAEFMTELTTELSALDVGYQVGSDDLYPGTVLWKRTISERTVDENARIIENSVEVEENELLVTLEAQGLVGLVHCAKQVEQGLPLQEGSCTLQQFVEERQENNPGKRVSLAVEGMDAFLRGNKTHFNRNFRSAVRNNSQTSTTSTGGRMFSDVSWVDCMEALASLHLATDCVARIFVNKQQLAEHVIVMTKALSEAHFRKENPFSFHVESGQGASRKALREADNRVSLIWKHQLMQFNNLSESMAAAVVASWPSPAHLLSAYESCSDKKSAELLLQDILIRRGVGVVSSTRRFGPVQSKRVHTMMTSNDPKLTLS